MPEAIISAKGTEAPTVRSGRFTTQAEYEQAMNDPIAAKYVRKCVGADELIKGKDRWCL